jgi:hypothetical protein
VLLIAARVIFMEGDLEKEVKLSPKEKVQHLLYSKLSPDFAEVVPGSEFVFMQNKEHVNARDIARATVLEAYKLATYGGVVALAAHYVFR